MQNKYNFESHSPENKLVIEVAKFCFNELKLQEGAKILLAVSGGSDSIAMTYIFNYLSHKYNFELSALTIDHGLRSESKEETEYVQNICEQLHIPCQLERFNAASVAKYMNMGLEEASRYYRYKLYEKHRIITGCNHIALAHQLEDLSEDILMRFIRGCGWPALGGMTARDYKRHIIRPLLWIAPETLRKYLDDKRIAWKEDQSNQSLKFFRNRIRHNILPLIKGENPQLGKIIQNIHRLSFIDEDYWNNLIADYKSCNSWQEGTTSETHWIRFPKKFLTPLHSAFRLRLYLYAIRKLSSLLSATHGTQARAITVFKLDNALKNKQSNKLFQFGNGLTVTVDRHFVTFTQAARVTRVGGDIVDGSLGGVYAKPRGV